MKTREEQREYERKWFSTPKGHAKRIEINKRRRHKMRIWFAEIKSNLSCATCGETHPATLDFHHVNPNEKDGAISAMVLASSKKKLLAEIEKCIVLCANCHRKLHYEEK